MKKFLSALAILLMLNPLCGAAGAIPDMYAEAAAAFLVEVKSGETLYAQEASKKVYPASITKIMTTLLALENGNLDDIVTASAEAVGSMDPAGSTSNIKEGEQMTLENMLYCIMLESANEGCNVIAEYISGDIPSFIELMNKRAAELGAEGTHFANTHGLHDEEHYTTAQDVALITLEAIKHPEFLEICNTAKKEIPATNLSEARYLTTTNHLISTLKLPDYIYHPAKGIKTGHTTPAGYCLVSIAEKNGLTLLSVIMGAEQVTDAAGKNIIQSFTETSRLFEWGFNNFWEQTIIKSSEPIAETKVALGLDVDFVTVHPEATVRAIIPKDYDISEFDHDITIFNEDNLTAPIEKGQALGNIVVSYNGREYANLRLVALNEVERSNMLYMLDRVKQTLSQPWVKYVVGGIIVLIAAYIIFMVSYNRRRRREAGRGNYRGKRRRNRK